ncbi:MAG: hypothetical protein ACWGQW_19460 [bacterium]
MTDNLNPQVREIEIGVRSLRKLTIYPMSMADQKRFGKVFQQVVEEYLSQTPEGPMQSEDLIPFAQFLIKLIGDNIKEVLKIITDMRDKEIETFFEEVTNAQMSDIIMAVFEENFDKPSKNLMSLFETVKLLFPLERLSQPFSNDTASGISATSTPEATGTEG